MSDYNWCHGPNCHTSKTVDRIRGVKGVEFLLRFLIFSIFPLIFELFLVSAILLQRFGFEYVLVVIIAITIFIGFTFRTTELHRE